jgi:DNA-binding MarR family transcriptional regulator
MGATMTGGRCRSESAILGCPPTRSRHHQNLDASLSLSKQAAGKGTGQSVVRPKITTDDYRALGQFRRAMREFLAFSEDGASAFGITSQQHQALLAIRAHPGDEPMSIGELAACLMIKNHSAIGLVARLMERDLVSRHTSEDDRRRIDLELRPLGVEILEAISVRNLRQLNETAEILAGILSTVRRIHTPPAPTPES